MHSRSRTVRLIGEHAALQDALDAAPRIHAAYRFTVKLREHGATLADCLDRVLTGLREAIPDLGTNLTIDGSDLPAYANGMRDLPNGKPRDHYADPDASWGHRSAGSTATSCRLHQNRPAARLADRDGLRL
jgi:hypothetical protein